MNFDDTAHWYNFEGHVRAVKLLTFQDVARPTPKPKKKKRKRRVRKCKD